MPDWLVEKFGGTSLADAEGFTRAAEIVGPGIERSVAVVVSAMAGVTDLLLEAVDRAARQDDAYLSPLHAARDLNIGAAEELLGDHGALIAAVIESGAQELEDVLRAIRLARTASEQNRELVSGYGELWSAQILHAHLCGAHGAHAAWLDARDVLIVHHDETGPTVHWDESVTRLNQWRARHPCDVLVVTGYIASDPTGAPTSLKRNGSDFTASIFARLLQASSITIWTDVDGVMSADPSLVPEAVVLPGITYHEAAELAYFGAAVLHPHTMGPAIADGIPIRIKNARDPDKPGTVLGVSADPPRAEGSRAEPRALIKAVSSSDDVALLNLEGVGLIGVPGVAQRLFGALRDVGVSVMMISQAGSEHSICAAIPLHQGDVAKVAVERAFHAELHHGQVQTVEVDGPYRIVAAVGERMVETPGVSGRLFGALGQSGINVRAIAQGASERNISVVVAKGEASRALRAVHAGFYLSDQTLSVGLIGPGRIGSELLSQIRSQAERLHERFHIDLRVRGIVRSSSMVLDERGIDLGRWEEALARDGEPVDLEKFNNHVNADHLPHAVVVDCSAAEALSEEYVRWLAAGVHVVTANKWATSGTLDLFQRIRAPLGSRRAHYFGSATVGAGLPVIDTLRDLIRTGDRVRRIEGVLSGTLSFVFNSLSAERPLSRVVEDARKRGYTEPDPREDLSGMDVARKALILAREMGLPLEPDDVSVESLVPPELSAGAGSADDFIEALARFDGPVAERLAKAARERSVLRYVAVIEEGRASVSTRVYPLGHAFAHLGGADNIVAFTTERYQDTPLIIQGPGAGPAVTAGGVFGDILRLASYLGAPS